MAISKIRLNGVTKMDVTDTTATVSDVASGKVFTQVDGTTGTGAAVVGDGWVRPAEWPDYDAINMTNQKVIYVTYDLSLIPEPFFGCILQAQTSSSVDIGYFQNGTFITLETMALGTNVHKGLSLTSYKSSYNYLVARITWSGNLTRCSFCPDGATVTIGSRVYKTWSQPMVEIYGNILEAGGPSLFNGVVKNHFVKSITLKNISLTQDSSFEALCSSCVNLERLYITCSDNYKFMGYNMAQGCHNLHDITIPKIKLSNAHSMFQNCRSLRSIDISKWDFSQTTAVDNMFNACTVLKSIGRSIITVPNATNSAYTFREAPLLKNVFLDAEIPNNVSNINNWFNTCGVTYKPSYIKSNVTNMGNFNNGRALGQYGVVLDFSEADLSGITYSANAFADTNYAGFIMPSTLALIGNEMFARNFECREYHFKSTTPPTVSNTNAFNNIPSDCIIYVPRSENQSVLNAYKTATNWSTYASYMQEEPQ